MVKDTVAINVMSSFAPDLASPLPPFCFSLPILVGCFLFHASTWSPSWVTCWKHFRMNSTNRAGGEQHAHQQTQTHTCTCGRICIGYLVGNEDDQLSWGRHMKNTFTANPYWGISANKNSFLIIISAKNPKVTLKLWSNPCFALFFSSLSFTSKIGEMQPGMFDTVKDSEEEQLMRWHITMRSVF